MKKLSLILCIWAMCTSYSAATEINSLNLIVNSELIENNFSCIKHEKFILVPLTNFLDKIKLNYNISTYTEEKMCIEFSNNKIELYPNSYTAYINDQKVDLVTPTVTQNNQIYVSTNLIKDLSDLYIYYDSYSNSIFVTPKSDFKKIDFFFNKIEKILKTFNSINIDVINEIISPNGSSYSIGNSIYIDKTLNKIFQKNILDNSWKESNIKISSATSNNFNETFFTGISVDKINSNNDYIIFKGYYPLDNNRICKSILYINPYTLEIEKQINEFDFESNFVKQTIFYSYN